jgi:hypothetical protein
MRVSTNSRAEPENESRTIREPMWDTVTSWLNKYESIAIWLEGIALVFIFIWDRLDSRADHKRMINQLKIAQDQTRAAQANAETAKLSVEMMINKERARIAITSRALD